MEKKTIVLYMVRYDEYYVKYFREKNDAIEQMRKYDSALYWTKVKVDQHQYRELIKIDEVS